MYRLVSVGEGVPRTLGLKDMIRHYLDHQREVVTRFAEPEILESSGLVVDGTVVVSGRVPSVDDLKQLLRSAHALDLPELTLDKLSARHDSMYREVVGEATTAVEEPGHGPDVADGLQGGAPEPRARHSRGAQRFRRG